MKICGFNKLTLLDYPEHIASTVFLGGCNFLCPFCHNGDLVVQEHAHTYLEEKEILVYLEKRKSMLAGVCISGGEPTLQQDLLSFIKKIKAMGYLVKLDTNGYNPEVLKEILEKNIVDYIAMDIKNCRRCYGMTCGLGESLDIGRIETSVDMLLEGKVPYEFRTTVARELHTEREIEEIAQWLQGAEKFFLQSYRESEGVLVKEFTSYTYEELKKMKTILCKYIAFVGIRGSE